MGHARTVKPEFFLDEEVATISPLGRLLFIGLWTMADREGRLQERASIIKAKCLPFDDADMAFLLGDLSAFGFIERYEVDGLRYIQICNWKRHQKCTGEKPSVLPANVKPEVKVEWPVPDALNTPTFLKAWESWVEHRRDIKAPVTENMARRMMARFLKMGVYRTVAAIEYSISQGWQGVYEQKGQFVYHTVDKPLLSEAERFEKRREARAKAE